MDSISRNFDTAQPRPDTGRAPRGDDLQQASNMFAELLTKERKEARNDKIKDERKDDDAKEARGGAYGADGQAESLSPYAGGIFLLGERGRGQQQQEQPKPEICFGDEAPDGPRFLGPPTACGDEAMAFEGGRFLGPPSFASDETFGGGRFLGPPISAGDDATTFEDRLFLGPPSTSGDEATSFDGGRFLGPPSTMGDEATAFEGGRFLGPPTATIDESTSFDGGRFLGPPVSESQQAGELGAESETPTVMPTPGELMLQAFSRPGVSAVQEAAEVKPTRTVDPLDSIMQLGDQIADRMLVTAADAAGPQEMLIQIKDSALPGTEVRMVHDGDRLKITLVTDHAASFDLLAARQVDLQKRLGDTVTIQLSFDPEGTISRQRMDRPIETEAGSHTGDDRGRERDPQGRSRGRQQDRERESNS